MAASTGNNDGLVTDINVTPLVDIMLVLLIVFMLTSGTLAQADRKDVVPVDLPTAASAESAPAAPLSVVIDSKGALYLDGEAITRPALQAKVRARVAAGDGPTAIVSADRAVDHGTVVGVIDALRLLGVRDVAINTKVQEIGA